MPMVSKTAGDQASYFGHFGGRSVTQHVIDTLRLTLKLPGCSKQFPRDLGKDLSLIHISFSVRSMFSSSMESVR